MKFKKALRSLLVFALALTLLPAIPAVTLAAPAPAAAASATTSSVTMNGTTYDSVQDALDEIKAASVTSETNYVIELGSGECTETAKVVQQQYKNITIKAAEGATVTWLPNAEAVAAAEANSSTHINAITVDGMSDTTFAKGSLQVKGIDFDFSSLAGNASLGPNNYVNAVATALLYGRTGYVYAHKITLTDCSVVGTGVAGSNTPTVLFRAANAGTRDVVIEGCSATGGAHSLVAATSVTGLTVSNCAAVCREGGINATGTGSIVVSNCDFTVGKYAIRVGATDNAGAPSSNYSLTVTNSKLRTSDPNTGTISIRSDGTKTVTITDSEIINTNGPAIQNRTLNDGSGYDFALSDNYWGPAGFESAFAGFTDTSKINTGTFATKVTLDANGGSFADGTTEATVTATVTNGGTLAANLGSAPTPSIGGGKVFAGWYTDAVNGDKVSTDFNGLGSDTTLYAHYVDGVATLNGVGYLTIQEALDAAMDAATPASATNYVVEVAAGTHNEALKILQQENKNIVLKAADGAEVVFTKSISIDGNGYSMDANKTARRAHGDETLRIEGIKFDFSGYTASADCITTINTMVPADGTNLHVSFVHNVTVKDCEFVGPSNPAIDIVGIRVASARAGGGRDITVENCTGSNLHSLAQMSWVGGSVLFKGCTVTDTHSGGVNIYRYAPDGNPYPEPPALDVQVQDCDFNVASYGVRVGSGSNTPASIAIDSSTSLTVTNSKLVVNDASAERGAIVLRDGASKNITVTDSILNNKAVGGYAVYNKVTAAPASEYVFSTEGTYFSPEGRPTAASFYGFSSDNPVEGATSYSVNLIFDAGEGTFATGESTEMVTIPIVLDAEGNPSNSGAALPETTPTRDGFAFIGWYSKAVGGTRVNAKSFGDVYENTTLYAHWSTVRVISDTTSVVYNGKAQTPAVTVREGLFSLTKDIDYTVEYINNTNVGTASIKVIGIGNYAGTEMIVKNFEITPVDLTGASITVANQTFTNKALKPAVTVKVGSLVLSAGDYSVAYANNTKPGAAQVTITAQGDNVTGTKTAAFTIVVKQGVVSKAASPKKAQAKVTWKKDAAVKGYEVQVAKNAKFSKGVKKATVTKASTTSKTFTKLTKGAKYYSRVRSYTTDAKGKKVYGAWSATKAVTVKK